MHKSYRILENVQTSLNIVSYICTAPFYINSTAPRFRAINNIARVDVPVDDTRTTTSLFPVQTITFVYPHLIAGLYERWRIPPTIHSCIFRHRLALASRHADIFDVTQSQPVSPSKRWAPSRRPVFCSD